MKTTREIDDLIREALGGEDSQVWDELGEQSIAELVTESFHGRHRFLQWYVVVVGLALTAVAVLCAVRMFQAPDDRTMLLWFAGGLLSVLGITGMKLWSWMELQRVALTREIKRVELQLAQLARRMGDGG